MLGNFDHKIKLIYVKLSNEFCMMILPIVNFSTKIN